MNLDLFEKTSRAVSKKITRNYSTSFSLGIFLLANEIRWAIYGIYGFVRQADEIVDTLHDFDRATLLKDFKSETYAAIANGISTNPVLQSFQEVVNKFNVDPDLIESFFKSMEMDLHKTSYEAAQYDEYIYGSAEVVGLMCLQVFCKGNKEEYNKLVEPAKALGSAFQKVNFLRDMKDDLEERGRVYFPNVDFYNFETEDKKKIEKEIGDEFQKAYEGIKQLPMTCRLGVYTAYIYYLQLLKKIQRTQAGTLVDQRIRVSNPHKMYLLVKSYSKYQLNMI